MKIAILGFAGQGQAAYDYWSRDKNELTICDQDKNIDVPKGAKHQLGKDYLKNLDKFDLLVRTPSLHPKDIMSTNPKSPKILDKVTTVTNEFFKVCPTKNVIGVTGTKGKGTTSSLIAKMLEAAGHHVHLGGNIGIAPLDMLNGNIRPNDWVVLELANFQLIDIKHSPPIGVCLMVAEEHLNWHADMDEYITAKQQMFAHQKGFDYAIYYADNPSSQQVVSVSKGIQLPYFASPGAFVENDSIMIDKRAVCSLSDVKLLGKHNLQNICAAITAFWQVSQDAAAIRWVVSTFAGLEHRLEKVRELSGVTYYNDSFASAPGACVAALDAIAEPKVLIAGGFERGLDLTEMATAFTEHNDDIRIALLIGQSAKRLEQSLKKAGFTNFKVLDDKKMSVIVKKAKAEAEKGDVVLLSPGFASFDMFNNFEDRGLQFKAAVKDL